MQLTLQRRHSAKCPDRGKGPNFLKCRGRCRFWICGTSDGHRIRESLGLRDYQRAVQAFSQRTSTRVERPQKAISAACSAFEEQHALAADETRRKYERILRFLTAHCNRC